MSNHSPKIVQGYTNNSVYVTQLWDGEGVVCEEHDNKKHVPKMYSHEIIVMFLEVAMDKLINDSL